MVIDRFRGEYSFLSNFYPCSIYWEALLYPSVEHAYQAAKTVDHSQRKSIAGAATAASAKKMGKLVSLRPDWEREKLMIMLELLWLKFRPGTDLASNLLSTGYSVLIEGNTWGDTYWGICRGTGRNILGKVLMKIRDCLYKMSECRRECAALPYSDSSEWRA